jgi:peptide/nickel transport system ATP-binding protein
VSGEEADKRSIEVLTKVGIPEPRRRLEAYPHELSGGMRQRVAIAIALINTPALIICDEPTTALDVSIQAQILTEMKALAATLGSALIWISHDLATVSSMASRILVMYAGQIVEQGTVEQVLTEPRMPYTMGLIESIPTVEKRGGRLSAIKGVVPSPFHLPPACRFEPRCPYEWELCREVPPELYPAGEGGRLSRCHLHLVESGPRRDAAVADHEQNMVVGRRLTGAPDRIGDA